MLDFYQLSISLIVMRKVKQLDTFEQIKLLADPRRLEILRLLMASAATLTQLARRLGKSPAWVKHHTLALESAGLIELAEVRTTGKITEKFYRTKAGALLLQELILPEGNKPVIVFSGSHDLALERVGEQITEYLTLLTLPVGSLDGLINLRQGLCQVSGAHLLDESGVYNLPYVRRIFPDRRMEVITLAYRTQGLIVAPGNPKGFKDVPDLAQSGARFTNRVPGSGTRLWLDSELERLDIPPEEIEGYQRTVNTHTECSQAVASGKADAAIGLQASAYQFQLDFIPLFEERYDLVLPHEQRTILAPLLDFIQTGAFREVISALTGYSTTHSGEQITI